MSGNLELMQGPSGAATEEPASESGASSKKNSVAELLPQQSPGFWAVDAMEEGIRLVMYNVSCKIGKKQMLYDVTGVVEPGEFYGVMGPSGAGKTMLMDIVCFRKSLGKVKGVVLYNGKQPTKDFVGHNVAYVEQQITVQPAFTVEEAITFSAMLKRPRSLFTRKEIEQTVDHVIEQLGLQKIRKSRVGNSRLVRGISGGEARRVSIGISLVQLTRPGLLCLDEPTTGLDSAIGNDILKLVRGCADEGWTIFTTIHNPSAMMMDHIDGLVLIVSARVIWFGPYNLEAMKVDYEAHGFHCERSQHIVEYLLQVVGGGSKGSDEDTLERACAAYDDSKECIQNKNTAVEYIKEAKMEKLCAEWRKPKRHIKLEGEDDKKWKDGERKGAFYANTIWQEINILLRFRAFTMLKDPSFVLSRLLIFVLQSLVFATFWADRKKNMSGLIDTIAVLFAVPITLSLPFGLFIPELFHQRGAFIRESHEGCYRTFSFCCSVLITEGTLVGIGSVMYSLILYFAIGTMPVTAGHFFFFLLSTWAVSLNSVLFANLATNLSRSMEMALLIAPCYWLWNCLVMGFITKYENMPVYYGWTYWLAYLQYAFYGFMLNQFQNEEWNMCAELGGASEFSLNTIVDALTQGNIANETGILLDKVQETLTEATDFEFPFRIADATCAANSTSEGVTLPNFVAAYLPDQGLLNTFLPLLPTFLGGGGDGDPKPVCNDLCIPVPGAKLLNMYGMDPEYNKWGKLGVVAAFAVGHFILMCFATSLAKRFEKR
ncbi:ATP-binding cassette transporter [Chloropicon primus]|uniref:ATP-binding cassette transporter n=2 Tax=Chloropicon primus TaxID=1764295 RepID=A0A5B8MPD6_9CHLO|nr:ATP-binding cassette transporter [Chloropicon primus]UPR01552.1 ATP-binding cassette transporter [Chloropicon primus]|mmetsp:Transcript_5452/g.11612  ORF Transcript_5452/g.11612 Transcript_5452/m.11612 type:complete len:771 (+) Transcript_5452:209-2521(+)|eukprot:QDZ22336.1 ATP-binding cassette transporter [Chloropicon primus]